MHPFYHMKRESGRRKTVYIPVKIVTLIHLTRRLSVCMIIITDSYPSVKHNFERGATMKIDMQKLTVAMANESMLLKDLCQKAGIGEVTFRNIRAGRSEPRPATVGKIAKALNVKVQDIIAEE